MSSTEVQGNQADVLIIGAGISGISAAVHLQEKCPDRSFLILEGRSSLGGTWDLFKYPGIRSDSDMHTLGFNFKPWTNAKAIADGPSIMKYLHATVAEYNLLDSIRFDQQVVSAEWSSEDAQWHVTVDHKGETVTYHANFVQMCTGYYSYDKPYQPEIAGLEDFAGTVIHPQLWPEDLDYTGKKVAVIGSGATAMTLVPAMADKAASMTMIQRSPTYVVSRPEQDKVANGLRAVLPDSWAYAITRFKNTRLQQFMYNRTRTQPEKVKKTILGMVKKELPDFDVDTHFTPSYNPWDQRMCLIPNADLFKSIRNGKTDVVTGHIDTVTPNGVRMQDGTEVEADILITATGLNLKVLGGTQFSVDGAPVDFSNTLTYKGMMYSDIPNLVQTFGYINASWTLRADLTSEYTCRVLNAMRDKGVEQVTARLRSADIGMPLRDWIEDFSAGYMRRVMHLFPKQGNAPWANTQDFAADKKMIRQAPIEDDVLTFGPSQPIEGGNTLEAPAEQDAMISAG